MRDHVFLYLNGSPVRVGGEDVFLSLSDFLRRRRGLTGTKVVCAEGDCGSCAALVGRVEGGVMRYAAVTSCIQLVFQLDGCHVVTVEGLRDGRELNPIQQAMVSCHGTQCGFCTPGFVVSLCDLMQDGRKLGAEEIRRGLVGNLCRCTGYDSIVRAATAVDPESMRSIDERYPPGPIVKALARAAGEEVHIWTDDERTFYKPVNFDDAIEFRSNLPHCTIVAGATDVGVVHNKRVREIRTALSISALSELRGVRVEAGSLYLGASESLSTLERATLEHIPEFGRFMSWFGSPLIKNAGTLGGNLVTGSPIGDTLPPLMALGAEIEIEGMTGRRVVPIGEFYTGYRKTVLDKDELVVGVRIPLLRDGETLKLYKVSRRKDLDISSFGAAVWMRQTNGTVDDIRIVYGGVGPMVMRMGKAEAVIRGQSPTLERFEQAAKIARDEVTPITDVRGSEQYRRTLAENVLMKFWHEMISPGAGSNGNGNGHPRTDSPGAPERGSLRVSSDAGV